jgi:3-oxoadipate enol-lactonase
LDVPEIEINGLNIAYLDQGSGPPIVAIHGWGGNKNVWRPQLDAFSRAHRFIAIDIPGHGDSGRPDGDHFYSPAACADMTRALMDRLGLDRAVLLGQSMGTFVSQLIYHSDPRRVIALVLTGALSRSPPAGKIAGIWVEDIVREIARRGIKDYLDDNVRFWFSPGFDPTRIEETTAERYKLAAHAAIAYCRAVAVLDIRDRLGEIRAPTLIIVGSEDGRTPVEESELMNRGIPDAWLKVIKGAGHLVNVEQPEAFNQPVLDFINTICQASGSVWRG